MNKIDRVFNTSLWTEGSFDPLKYQREPQKFEIKSQRWHLVGVVEVFIQRITGVFWSDASASTREDMAVVAEIRKYSEELKASEKRLVAIERQVKKIGKTNQPVPPKLEQRLVEARKDWEKVTLTLQKLKSNYSRNPNIRSTFSYHRLNSLEKAINARLKQFMYVKGDPKMVETLQTARDFEVAYYYNTLISPLSPAMLAPGQVQLNALQEIVDQPSDSNPFNSDIKEQARQLKEKIRQEMIDTYLSMNRGRTRKEVKTFVDAHAHATQHFTPEMKSLLKFALNGLGKKEFEQTTSKLNSLKNEAYLNYLSSIFNGYVQSKQGDIGLQTLSSKVAGDLDAIRNIPAEQCLQHVQAAVAGLRDCPHLIKCLQEIHSSKEKREQLINRIRPAGHVDNLLVLSDVLKPYARDHRYSQAQKELLNLKRNAYLVRMEGLTEEGRALLDRTEKMITVPFTVKLALVAALYDDEFRGKFRTVLDSLNDRPSVDRLAQSWKSEMHPLLLQPALDQKIMAINNLGPLLAAKVSGQSERSLEEAFSYNLEILKFVEGHAQSKGLNPGTKTLLNEALAALQSRDPQARADILKQLGSAKNENYLDLLERLLSQHVAAMPSEEKQTLLHQAKQGIADIREALLEQYLRHIKSCIPAVDQAPQFMRAMAHLPSAERQILLEHLHPGREDENMLLLLDTIDHKISYEGAEEWEKSMKTYLQTKVEQLPSDSRKTLQAIEKLTGENFPLKTSLKLALALMVGKPGQRQALDAWIEQLKKQQAACLKNPDLVDLNANPQLRMDRIEIMEMLDDRIREPFNVLSEILLGKVGMLAITIHEQSVETAVLDETRLTGNIGAVRAYQTRIGALQNLPLYSPEERFLLQMSVPPKGFGGFRPFGKLNCYEYFSCQPDGNPAFNERGIRPFVSGTFAMGYALPGVGMAVTTKRLDFSSLEVSRLTDEEYVQLFHYVHDCLRSPDEKARTLAEANDPSFLRKFTAEQRAELAAIVLKFKHELDRDLGLAYVAIGNPTVTPPASITVTPWEKMIQAPRATAG